MQIADVTYSLRIAINFCWSAGAPSAPARGALGQQAHAALFPAIEVRVGPFV